MTSPNAADGPDPTTCPDCWRRFPAGSTSCPHCGLPLVGPLAGELWQVSSHIAWLQARRQTLLAALRAGGGAAVGAPSTTGVAPGAPPTAPAPSSAGAPSPAVPPTPWPASPGQPPAPWPAPPRAEWTPKRVQNLLLSLGVLLLVVAALIFAAVAWGHLGAGGRAVALLGLTAIAGLSADVALRRGLAATAESLTTFTVVLALVDAYALRRAGFAALDETDAATYWSVASGVVGVATAGYAAVVRVRAARTAAAALLQLPLLVTVARLDNVAVGVRASALALQSAAVVAVAALLRRARQLPDARLVLDAGGVATWVVALGIATVVAYPDRLPSTVPRPASLAIGALVVIAGAGALAAWLWRELPVVRDVAAGAATVAAALATVAPSRFTLTPEQQPLAIAATGLVAVICAGLLVRSWRLGPLVVGAGTGALALCFVAVDAVIGVTGPLSWVIDPWSGDRTLGARDVLGPDLTWHGTVVTTVVLGVAAVSAVLVGELLHARRAALVPAGVLTAATVLLVPLGQAWSYDGALLWDVALGLALLAVALVSDRFTTLGVTGLGVASAVIAVAIGWALADKQATLFVLAATGLGYGVVAFATSVLRPLTAAAAAVLECAWLFAAARSVGTPVDRSGFVLATAATAVLVIAAVVRRHTADGVALEIAAVATYAAALMCTARDPGWLAWTLALGGVAALGNALRSERRSTAVVGGLLLSASSWVRLRLADVDAPEPYVAPLAAIALVLGHLRRRRDPRISSWAAYATGISLALGPSLVVVVDGDPGLARPLLVGLAALLVLLYGVRERLQAPLLLGSAALAVDALVQLAPLAAALPRWLSIGAVGVLLVAIGATYEQRRNELRRVRARYDALG
ncbi:MAG: SCO7613 C-terminal domain-containing membrane protein [Mycobacteriales bacterium]